MEKYENIYNVVGKNIKKYRKLKGWKQKELAEKTMLSDSLIAKMESITYQTISLDTLELIANTLEVDIKNFFNRE